MAAISLKGQRIVVLGGTQGIGFAVAEQAMREGAEVVIGSSSQANVASATQRLGDGAQGIAVDVQAESSLAQFFQTVGPFDHLVFTAGEAGTTYSVGPVAQMDLSTADAALQVRFWGALAAIKHAQATLSKTGSITLTDGVLAITPLKGAFLAAAFGGTVQHLVRGLAIDLAPVRVNSVCPGIIHTERVAAWGEGNIRNYTAQLPVSRAGTPEEAAEAYLYCMRGGYTTGQVMIVDGGRSLL